MQQGRKWLIITLTLRGELPSVGDDDDDRGLEVEGVAALPVHVDARLHPVDVQGVEDLIN